ncbi:hypothetical protein IU438_23690 [Nocardia cyriacigeorgica]|uniref:hypothetical protein n=1 Tax=Nocardia cyriacigeorgica TaxID=135487 RepID=UPI001894E097|nr:hypothetical protein [Nocardia cyriacigeorgica]MBF6398789.1 hypothetical protein [Nocardia cyriacigeorgica]MBF6403697.1 hypothetical protein [Nocardia cyriacigeorgica]
MVTAKSLKVLIASAIVADGVQQQIHEVRGRGSWRDLSHSDSFARFSDPLLPGRRRRPREAPEEIRLE